MFLKTKQTRENNLKESLNILNISRKQGIKVKLIFKSSPENEVLLSGVLNILLPKEAIKSYLITKNRNNKI